MAHPLRGWNADLPVLCRQFDLAQSQTLAKSDKFFVPDI
jgi:hypothetical protein